MQLKTLWTRATAQVALLRQIGFALVVACSLQGANVSIAHAQAPAFEEYGRQWGLRNIGALFPWGAGATGQGAVVALVDSGVAAGHVDLAGKIIPGVDFVSGGNGTSDTTGSSHGTFIAGLIVGSKNGTGIVGTAYGARIIPVRVNDSANAAPSARVAQGVTWATNSQARIINLARAGGVEAGDSVLNALRGAAGAGKAVVMPAGNVGGAGPLYPAQYAAQMGGYGLIVGALAPGGGIAGFSNRAGGLATHYVVAPGDAVVSTTNNGGYTTSSGTSWATGFASGALALLLGAFPELDAKDAIDILKTTATDLGAPGVDNTYGWGAINVQRALAPQGELEVPGGSDSSSAGIVVAAALIVGGAVAWRKLKKNKQLKQTMIIDGYGRGYTADITDLIQPRDEGTGLDSAMQTLRMEHTTTQLAVGQDATTTISWSADRLSQQLQNRSTDADDLNRDDVDWSMSFNGKVAPITTLALNRNMDSRLGWGQDTDQTTATAGFQRADIFQGAHLGFAPRADAIALGFDAGKGVDVRLGLMATDEDERFGRVSDTAAIEAGMNITDRARVSLSLSQTSEDGSLLGGASRGALSVNKATTTALGVNARYRLGEKFSLVASWSTGTTSVQENPNALLQDVSTIKSDAWGLGLVGTNVFNQDDVFGVAVSQPLKVSSGSGVIKVPFSRTITGDLLTRSENWNMAPDATETDIEMFYQRRIGKATRLGAWFLYQDAPFHANEIKDRASFFTTISRDF